MLLSGEPEITVAGVFNTAEEALLKIKESKPDMLLTDLGLPDMSGVELIHRIKEALPDIEIMAYTVFEDRETVFSAIKAGASGYILKESSPRELIEALHNLYRGGSPMSPKIARAVIRDMQSDKVADLFILSQREQDILRSVEKGLTYKEIGDLFHISPHTVHTHIKKIYEKLQAKNRQEALIKGRRKGML